VKLGLFALLALGAVPAFAQGLPASATSPAAVAWEPIGIGPEGLGLPRGRPVYALAATPDGSLYAGGDFGLPLGEEALGGIARWTGSAWERPGGGLNGSVSALAVGPEGALYAAGGFTVPGPPWQTARVARWDGEGWHLLPDPLEANHTVRALALSPEGRLYVGGSVLEWPQTEWEGFVAEWDGGRWAVLGRTPAPRALGGPSLPGVYHLGVGQDGDLYAGGIFDAVGEVPAVGIARWDGQAWGGTGAPSYPVAGLAVGGQGIPYAGFQDPEHGPYVAGLEEGAWRPLPLSPSLTPQALEAGPDGTLYLTVLLPAESGHAEGRLMRWQGGQWEPLPGGFSTPDRPQDPLALALAVTPEGAVYVGGTFSEAGGRPAQNVARWDTQGWQPLGSGTSEEVSTLLTARDGSVYAGGDFAFIGGQWASRVARWDGSAWHPLGEGMGGWNATVHTLAEGPDGSLYGGGAFTLAGGAPARNVARWDGSAWHPLGSGLSGRVTALAVGAGGDLYAGGGFWEADGLPARRVARWDGTRWHPMGEGFEAGLITALARTPDGSVYAAFDLPSVGMDRSRGLMRWDGQAWHPVGEGSPGSIRALLVGEDGALYAVGQGFHDPSSPQTFAPPMARWDGERWDLVGTGIQGSADAISQAPDGSLYVGGGVGVVRWDGQTWQAVAGAPSHGVLALAHSQDGGLYVGGRFLRAGDLPAPYIARATGLPVSAGAPAASRAALELEAPYPNPALGAVTLWFTLPEAGPVRLTVYDLLGREALRVVEGVLPAGGHETRVSVQGLPAGVYVLRLEAGGEARSRRLVVVR
jgi:trimeric autotransporter adhesin